MELFANSNIARAGLNKSRIVMATVSAVSANANAQTAGACWKESLVRTHAQTKFVRSDVEITANASRELAFASRAGQDPIAKTQTAPATAPGTDSAASLLLTVQASAFVIMDGAVPDASVWPSTCR
mmetsp:Transcript_133552/g.249746  ORF Transcript_133552/g.249746 Transcript_133552/m.249746 type:complete len:126 (+) Transcript_133552:2788-3165(+)